MKVGDLVRHRFEGSWNEVGVVIEVIKCIGIHPGGMANVRWIVEDTHRSDHLYRTRDLEIVK